jgi:hypothetical protein
MALMRSNDMDRINRLCGVGTGIEINYDLR